MYLSYLDFSLWSWIWTACIL